LNKEDIFGILATSSQDEWIVDDETGSYTYKKIIVTEGFLKKTDKLPSNIKERTIRLKNEYFNRIKKGGYYE